MSWSKALLLVASPLLAASSAAPEPLEYQIERVGVTRVFVTSSFDVVYTPPLGEPTRSFLEGTTELAGFPTGSGVADVGLPDQFAGGATGLVLSAWDAHVEFDDFSALFTNIFDGIVPLLPAPPPIPLTGAVLAVDIASFELNLLGPLESSLLSIDDPSEFYWAGVAPMRVAGDLQLSIWIPGQETIQFASGSFSLASSQAALTGSFDGDATQTRVVVGLDDANLRPDTTGLEGTYVLDLTPLGVITVTPRRMRLLVNGHIRALNGEYGLPVAAPASAVGCGIGPELAALLPALAWLRRGRRARVS